MNWENIFAEHFEADDATVYALRSDLARLLRGYLEKQGSQAATAKRLGIQQSVVSNIMTGNIESLSLERLIKFSVRAGIPGTAQWAESPHTARVIAGAFITPVPFLTKRFDPEGMPDLSFYSFDSDPWDVGISARASTSTSEVESIKKPARAAR